MRRGKAKKKMKWKGNKSVSDWAVQAREAQTAHLGCLPSRALQGAEASCAKRQYACHRDDLCRKVEEMRSREALGLVQFGPVVSFPRLTV